MNVDERYKSHGAWFVDTVRTSVFTEVEDFEQRHNII